MPSPRRAAFLGLTLLILTGCGGKPVDEGDPLSRNTRQLIGGLSEIYSYAQVKLHRPPAKVQEIEPYSRAETFVYPSVLRGDVVVLWGANIGAGSAILAYEKDAPAKGGWVLLQDRSMKQMSAEEFKAAPKAK